MLNLNKKPILIILMLILTTYYGQAQTTTITGTVTEESPSGTPMPGVNIIVQGGIMGTITNSEGKYSLSVNSPVPFTLSFSFIGFKTQEVQVTDTQQTVYDVSMEVQNELGQEVVVSASRVEESIMKSPVSIEKMGILDVQQTPSDNYYKGLAYMKGLDVSTSSVNFQIINARGFNSTGNVRFIQLNDGMDTQAPALNFPIGNLNGPSELDVASIEFVPGASSALYGPAAFNGALLVTSKSPFEFQGLSAFTKFGMNHIGGTSTLDSDAPVGPSSAQPMQEYALRYAQAFNNRIAFKVGFSYSRATDWYGTNRKDKSKSLQPSELSFNPGIEKVHEYGDEVSANLALVGLSAGSSFPSGLQSYIPYLPNHIVSRTGYAEEHLVDYNASNLKANVALHYRINDKMELLGQWNYGGGTSVYTGNQRYSLQNFYINQYKVELKGDNFFLRGYKTQENSGDSYIADLSGVLINSEWKGNSAWFGQYAATYLGTLQQQGFTPAAGASPSIEQQVAAHTAARVAADQGRYLPGTAEFNTAFEKSKSAVIPQGSLFQDNTSLYHVEGQYNFKNEIKFVDLLAGASFRLYELNSRGTIFADTPGNDITIQETGAYLQASKQVIESLRLIGSIRYDKNQNFSSQINPRISAVYTLGEKNFRASYQTGFRNPSTQGQHIDLNAVSVRLLGGLPYYAEKHNVFVPGQTYTLNSVEQYIAKTTANLSNSEYITQLGGASNAGLALGDPEAIKLLKPVNSVEKVRPEQVRNVEVGYRQSINNRVILDFAYYHNTISHYISGIVVRKASGVIDQSASTIIDQNVRNAQGLLVPESAPGKENTFSVYNNISDRKVRSHGAALGADVILGKGYLIRTNYNWNTLVSGTLGGDNLFESYNTPEHKFNVGFGNRKLTDKLGFNINYRWQSKFFWAASFARGIVPSVGTVDAQVSYKLKPLKSVLKVGGSNIFNTRYILNYGGPTLGAIYYVSLTFDSLFY